MKLKRKYRLSEAIGMKKQIFISFNYFLSSQSSKCISLLYFHLSATRNRKKGGAKHAYIEHGIFTLSQFRTPFKYPDNKLQIFFCMYFGEAFIVLMLCIRYCRFE